MRKHGRWHMKRVARWFTREEQDARIERLAARADGGRALAKYMRQLPYPPKDAIREGA